MEGKTGPKFTKLAEDLLRSNACHRAKFHHARPNNVREKWYNKFFMHLWILSPSGTPWAKVQQAQKWRTAWP